jgi:hypothetical protein
LPRVIALLRIPTASVDAWPNPSFRLSTIDFLNIKSAFCPIIVVIFNTALWNSYHLLELR